MNPPTARAQFTSGRVLTACSGLALLAALTSSCLVHGDRCGEHQIERSDPAHNCICEPGFVADPVGYGCTPCGPNEEARDNACSCKPGFRRPTPEAACEPAPGDAAGTCGDADCADAARQP